ncbi:hypothetical protein ACFV46_11690 [Streptomyces sp. NPDC059852]|uniref:hypothetical protein n=1 Tax=Streptomyces sp. NPDC059852 TaxID=3346972 RepID=UPI00364DCFDA
MTRPEPTAHDGLARVLLWPALVLSVVGNAVASVAGADTAVNLGFGAFTAVTAATLAVRRWREHS